MAAPLIKVTPEQLRSRATTLAGKWDNFENAIKDMDKFINGLTDVWEGDSLTGFKDLFTKVATEIRKLKTTVDGLATNMRDTAQIIEETDNKIGNQLRNSR